MNNISSSVNDLSSSVSDLTGTAMDAAGDALGIAGDFAGDVTDVIGDLAGAALAAAAFPGAKAGVFSRGWGVARRYPYVLATAVLAVVGYKYWKSKQDSSSEAPDSFPEAPSTPDEAEKETVESLTAPTT